MRPDATIRVLRIIARLNVGGPAIHVGLLGAGLDGLQPTRYRTRLLTGQLGPGEGDMEGFARERGVVVERVPGLGREIAAGGDLRALAYMRWVCAEFKPHIVHTHTAKAGTLGRLAAILHNYSRAPGTPRSVLVHTFHGHVLKGYFGRAKQGAFRSVERFLARRTDRLVVPAKRLADDLVGIRIGRPEQYSVVPLGFELGPFLALGERGNAQGPLRKELDIRGDVFLVGIVGRLTAVKNHGMFLEAAARLKRRTRTPIRFVVIGDGERRVELQQRVHELGLEEQVTFTGWRTDLPEVYRDLDAVALTSVNEGTPVSLIEAMASGRPVVSTGVGGVPEVIEDGVNGMLVDVGRDDLFAIAMGRLADEPELRARMAQAGRKAAAERYQLDRLLADLDALYTDLLASRPGVIGYGGAR